MYPREVLEAELRQLCNKFADKMYAKMIKSEEKYNFNGRWKWDYQIPKMQQALAEHVNKGDPIDVANFCAFLDYHGASTNVP